MDLAVNIHSFKPIKVTFKDYLSLNASLGNTCSSSELKLRNLAVTRTLKCCTLNEQHVETCKFQVGDEIHF